MTKLLVPAGQPLGAAVGTDDGHGNRASVVRLGDEFQTLDRGEYRLWLHAIGAEDTAVLRRRARVDGMAVGVDEAIDALFELGLLVSLDPGGGLESTLARHVLVAQGLGQGSNPRRPEEFVICGPGLEPLLRVDIVTYAVWAHSCHSPLADACEVAARRLQRPVDDVAKVVKAKLPALVGAGCAIVDRAVEADA